MTTRIKFCDGTGLDTQFYTFRIFFVVRVCTESAYTYVYVSEMKPPFLHCVSSPLFFFSLWSISKFIRFTQLESLLNLRVQCSQVCKNTLKYIHIYIYLRYHINTNFTILSFISFAIKPQL